MKTHNWYKSVYFISITAMYLLYAVALFGISSIAPQYLTYLNTFIKYYVLLVLLIRFNPIYKFKVDNFDRRIVFSFVSFYLITTAITAGVQKLIMKNVENIRENVNNNVIKPFSYNIKQTFHN